MKEEMVSIIVPVYNVEKYLKRCVDSILAQTYPKLEIVLVDDGSTDSSGTMCDSYSKMDERIRVIHKENGGLSDARNVGLDNITGEFVFFVDSDDWIDKNCIKFLYELLTSDDADIAVCGFIRISILENEIAIDNNFIERNTNEAMEFLIKNEDTNYAWGKLYRRQVFDGIYFIKGRLFEDIAIMYQLYDRAKKVVFSNNQFYFYYINPQSITGLYNNNARALYHVLLGWNEQYAFCKEKYPDLAISCAKKIIHYSIRIFESMVNYEEETVRNTLELIKDNLGLLLRNSTMKQKAKILLMVACPKIYIKKNK